MQPSAPGPIDVSPGAQVPHGEVRMVEAAPVLAPLRPAALAERPTWLAVLVGAWLLAASGTPLRAAEEAPVEGLVVQVPTVVTSEATSRLRAALFEPRKRFEARRKQGPAGVFKLICDFTPDGPGAS